MKAQLLALGLAVSGAALATGAAYAVGVSDTDQERAARWDELRGSIFGQTKVEKSDKVEIDAPTRADDAALVPVTLKLTDPDQVKNLTFIIDDNPTPLAAKFTFGPAADASQIKLRVRINNYTDVHAVTETKDGQFFESKDFVKASGGCSAPIGMSDEEAMKGMGDMRMKFGGGEGKPVEATLMIRHPNFSGMQMNQVSRDYTPARFINAIDVTAGDKLVFHFDGDISISSNPVINFGLKPDVTGPLKVVATDNQGGRWEQTFTAKTASN